MEIRDMKTRALLDNIRVSWYGTSEESLIVLAIQQDVKVTDSSTLVSMSTDEARELARHLTEAADYKAEK